ncbi:restriction endonuclease subunit S [Enterococcus faecium]|uniref:restriction endonuclease subunit S n=1 Tax=Enterococcus faecium TaxID=1352 RepID=UPI000BBBDFA8|nr:restriction endonuclease subunit S [Enterococcus faecium]KAA9178875.1 restriction endonuclease subunit S [Enterococcus faecium]KAA9207373.1 restriction endonuclease subunit S [Enterococcus faecium]MBD9746252.1 restriction endonuclease subunit S [Enterococcus faecium]MDQ8395608.1 restriction endonuclease subunit S [Enterococcus faecium]PCD98608.1 restriction endonuclease subunit S [Enterococcus faecium]
MSNDTQPEIRFPGFTEAWEQRKLSDVASIVGGGTPSTSNPEYWDGDIDWYAPAEIGDQIYVNKSLKTITELGQQKSSAKILPIGTVLFTSRAGIGNTAILAKEGTTNQGFQSIVPHENKLDSYFIFSRTHELKRYGEVTGAGSTFAEVSGKQMAKMPILIPYIDEQRKIGAFFGQIDEAIALHQRKLDLLKETKKGFLQKMFPKNGAKVPEIRFPGFTEDWEERRLNDFISGDISDGDWIEKEHIKDEGKYRIIQTGNIGNGVYIDKEKSAKYMDQNSFDILKANEIFPGDLLVSRLAEPAGRTVILPNIEDRMVTAVDVTILRQNENFDAYFLLSQMNTSKILNKVSKNVSGTSHKRISRKNLEKVTIDSTSIEEQNKIGAFFKQLDDTIALHQRKLDLLKETKKGFLQKMFV